MHRRFRYMQKAPGKAGAFCVYDGGLNPFPNGGNNAPPARKASFAGGQNRADKRKVCGETFPASLLSSSKPTFTRSIFPRRLPSHEGSDEI